MCAERNIIDAGYSASGQLLYLRRLWLRECLYLRRLQLRECLYLRRLQLRECLG